ncbi:uncharacterized protein FOMMEDRAFT_167312 [Fomitiporia mediterranea MF3/22]|uniref:uncharacterized protein n=1 Tax=Fomitiporia mediterranea (strain MF3/22) TaxID=694068 RepID=UPI00044090E7|nr:uncharacterized protein FOMMEDRAFT_167312 [Fomitiporia mediterranea MF3/22]EJD04029.1 hypothetical protein FOMMEDRAFT_167312 [Fomitiporia mediterranea MF3/22]
MSQLEQQVLELQQEKSQLVAQLDGINAPAHAAASVAGAPIPTSASGTHPIDPDLRRDLGFGSDLDPPPRTKRPRTMAATSADRDLPHAHPQLYQDTIRRMEERILELERWSEDLNGDLTDALDSESHLKHELSHALHSVDSHARRLADALHQLETERARAARELADMTAARDAEATSARTLRDANAGLRESVEAAEVTLDLQRVENERLRDRLEEHDARAARAASRLEDELRETRLVLDEVQMENRRLRKLLREQDALEDASLSSRLEAREHERRERDRLYARSPSNLTISPPRC